MKKLEEALPGGSAAGIIRQEYDIVIKEIEEMIVVSTRFRGAYSDVGKYIGSLYKAAGNKSFGCPFSLYYDEEYREGCGCGAVRSGKGYGSGVRNQLP